LNADLRTLHDRIERECQELERTVQIASAAWEGANRFPNQQTHFLNSLALSLHSFYNGLERIFEMIARQLDPTFPSGERWHRELLEQMGWEIPGVRPSVLSIDSIEKLDEFLAFRHRVLNIYTFHLDAERLHELLTRLSDAWQHAQADIQIFTNLLRQAAGDE
jgi:hypothetical protein